MPQKILTTTLLRIEYDQNGCLDVLKSLGWIMFELSEIVPWGRSYDEYVAMFDLSESDLEGTILGCGDGPSEFNAELTEREGSCVSVDPLYALSGPVLRQRIAETYDTVLEQTRKNQDRYLWKSVPSVEKLGEIRMTAMTRFLDDYEDGKKEGRYRNHALPSLPFEDGTFDLALSSHFLFLYSGHLSRDFHQAGVEELCRVAREVRIFPVVDLDGRPSPYVTDVINHVARKGFVGDIQPVPYEFQKGGNRMLVFRKAEEA